MNTNQIIDKVFNGYDKFNQPVPNSVQQFSEQFEHELCEIYWTEKEILKTMYRILPQIKNPILTLTLLKYCKVNLLQIRRLDLVFKHISKSVETKYCEAIAESVQDIKSSLSLVYYGFNHELEFYSAAQKIFKYTINSYLLLISAAESLGYINTLDILNQNLKETRNAYFWLCEEKLQIRI